jgi:hypothetical protein
VILSRALSILTASGVLLAGSVLWTLTRDRRFRAVIAGLSAYGAVAFVHAAVTGLTVRALLGGGGLFSALPRVLQGAVVGAVVVLPLGWIAATVRAGIPRFRARSPHRAIYQSVALAVTLALVISSLPAWSGDPVQPDARATLIQLKALERSLRAIADADRESPRDRWDPAFVVQAVGKDPNALFEWVRANTRWIPYRGRLRGASGVLMDRDGNSLDRSILLAYLLRISGRTVRLAHAELPGPMSADLMDLAVSSAGPEQIIAAARSGPPPTGASIPDGTSTVRRLIRVDQLDESAVTQQIGAAQGALERLRADLNLRVTNQATRLLAAVAPSQPEQDLKRRRAMAAAALRDHWWVQMQQGDQWVDCDLIAGGRMGQSLAAPTLVVALEDLPRELSHEVVIRIVAEHQVRGDRREERILEYTVIPADAAGRAYVLQVWPAAWPSQIAHTIDGRFGVKAAALEQKEWAAVLAHDNGEPVAHGVIGEAPAPVRTNPLPGFAGAFTTQSAPPTQDAKLTAVWIEYETHAPGADPETVRRVLFDLREAATKRQTNTGTAAFSDAERVSRNLALMTQTEILVVGCHLAPEWIAHLTNVSAASTFPLVRSLASGEGPPLTREALTKQVAGASRAVSPLYLLAMSRVAFTADDNPVVIESPNILTRHRYPRLAQDDVWLASAFDIVLNRVGVALNVRDEFAARVRQGVVDTNLEALLSGDRTASNTADAYNEQHDWATFTSADLAAVDRLPGTPESRLAMVEDLRHGYVLVAPKGARAAQNVTSVGWWRVHALTGDTLGLGANGWGMGPEDSALFNMAVSAARGFSFEYGLCQGFPAGINLLRYLNDSYFDSWHPNWTTYNRSRSAQEVFDDNNARCLISAIAMGVVATLPILLMTLNNHYMRQALRLEEEVAAMEAQADAEAKALQEEVENSLKLPGFDGPTPLPVRTQVWRDAGYSDTLVPRPQAGWRADPAQVLARENSIRAAEDGMNRAQQELNVSMREYLEYLNGRKPIQYGGRLLDPRYDPEVLEALYQRVELDFGRYSDRVNDLVKLDPSRSGGWGGPGGAPPPPNPIGNNNITQDAQVVGAAGAKGALK